MKQFVKIDTALMTAFKTAKEKALYLEVMGLAYKSGYAYASLEYYQKQLSVGRSTIIRTFNSLLENGWLWKTTKANCATRYFPRDSAGRAVYPIRDPRARKELKEKYGEDTPPV